MKPDFRWPWQDRVTNKELKSLLEQLMSTAITSAQALADLQKASTDIAAGTAATAANLAQLSTDLKTFIANSQAAGGVDPTAAEAVAQSVEAAAQSAQASAAAAASLDASVNPPTPPAPGSAPSASARRA